MYSERCILNYIYDYILLFNKLYIKNTIKSVIGDSRYKIHSLAMYLVCFYFMTFGSTFVTNGELYIMCCKL